MTDCAFLGSKVVRENLEKKKSNSEEMKENLRIRGLRG